MKLLFDQYLVQAGKLAKLDFAWDEWKIHDDYANAKTGFEQRLEEISDGGNIALGIALAEWIVAALREYDREKLVLHYIQSAWAAFSLKHSPTYFETDDDDWRGPFRGMLNMTLIILNDAIYCRDEDPDVADRTNQILFYALKLFSNSADFIDWLEVCVVRLESNNPLKEPRTEIFGLPFNPPIPRETFGAEYASINNPQNLIEAYLDKVSLGNPFLEDKE